jgi:hypothetical protein
MMREPVILPSFEDTAADDEGISRELLASD